MVLLTKSIELRLEQPFQFKAPLSQEAHREALSKSLSVRLIYGLDVDVNMRKPPASVPEFLGATLTWKPDRCITLQ